ncbi:MAG: TIR domain-containing protein [Crocinitomicaceae bacterium]|nr:TIR domain-containing protein [Crocinitomicaceae bacterium]MCF8444695.1 TIR domain-containing protein [Crocinitomicaceae bacterium]
MPPLKTYDLFLSHAWKYNSDYYRLEQFLKAAPYFKFRNYSVPIHNPLVDPNTPTGIRFLTGELERQVKPVNCVLVLAGMYAAHSDWIHREINLANKYNKPIIGVIPWGQQRVPLVVQNASHAMVGWNTNSIISAIRELSI